MSQFLEDSRSYSAEAGLIALPVHLNRLEAAAEFENGDVDRALDLALRAREGFAGLKARWEIARTDLLVCELLTAQERYEEAQNRLPPAFAILEDMRTTADINKAQELRDRLG